MASCAQGEYIEKLYVRFRTPGDDFVRSVHRSLQRLRPWFWAVVVQAHPDARTNGDAEADCNACTDGYASANACADGYASANRNTNSELRLRSSGVTAEFHLSRWKRRLLGQRQSL